MSCLCRSSAADSDELLSARGGPPEPHHLPEDVWHDATEDVDWSDAEMGDGEGWSVVHHRQRRHLASQARRGEKSSSDGASLLTSQSPAGSGEGPREPLDEEDEVPHSAATPPPVERARLLADMRAAITKPGVSTEGTACAAEEVTGRREAGAGN